MTTICRSKMDIFEIKQALQSMEILVDTRERDTDALQRRLADMGYPYRRQKLNFGDYSAACTLSDGRTADFSGSVAVERKMSLDELCNCYCRERARFEREFGRAAAHGAKLYLLIENGDWEKVYNGSYRSLMSPQALRASMLAWLARYNCQLIFCRPETSGRLIGDILYREVKERMERGDLDEPGE